MIKSSFNFIHKPVLLNESINFFTNKKNSIFIDGTFGDGGHTKALLEKNKTCKVPEPTPLRISTRSAISSFNTHIKLDKVGLIITKNIANVILKSIKNKYPSIKIKKKVFLIIYINCKIPCPTNLAVSDRIFLIIYP